MLCYYLTKTKKEVTKSVRSCFLFLGSWIGISRSKSSVHRSDVRMTMLLVHHNSFFNLSDHLTKLISKEFKRGEAGKTFSYGITKIAALINSIGALMKQYLINRMNGELFSIMPDASNDSGLHKMLPVMVRLFDIKFDEVITKFLDMNTPVGRNASTAFHYLTNLN